MTPINFCLFLLLGFAAVGLCTNLRGSFEDNAADCFIVKVVVKFANFPLSTFTENEDVLFDALNTTLRGTLNLSTGHMKGIAVDQELSELRPLEVKGPVLCVTTNLKFQRPISVGLKSALVSLEKAMNVEKIWGMFTLEATKAKVSLPNDAYMLSKAQSGKQILISM